MPRNVGAEVLYDQRLLKTYATYDGVFFGTAVSVLN